MRFKRMRFNAKPDDSGSALEDSVAAAAAKAAASLPAPKETEKPEEEDARLELVVRRISDAVTKSIAELLNPTAKPLEADEEEVEEAGKKVRRKRKPKESSPVKKKTSWSLFG